jgi:hypothetical protein
MKLLALPSKEAPRLILIFAIILIALAVLLGREAFVLTSPNTPWATEFTEPEAENLVFEVTNLRVPASFHYRLTNEAGALLREGDATFGPEPSPVDPAQGLDEKILEGKLVLTVTDREGATRTLYKVFPKP